MNLRSVGNLGWTEVLWLAVRAWKGEITTAELLVRREYFCHWNLGMKLKLRAAHLSRCHFPLELSWVCACLPCLLPSTLHPDQACSLQCLNKKLLRCGGETGCLLLLLQFLFLFFFLQICSEWWPIDQICIWQAIYITRTITGEAKYVVCCPLYA